MEKYMKKPIHKMFIGNNIKSYIICTLKLKRSTATLSTEKRIDANAAQPRKILKMRGLSFEMLKEKKRKEK